MKGVPLLVIVMLPSVALGVAVSEPLKVVVPAVNCTLGIVRLRAVADQVVLLAPRCTWNGAKFS